MKYILDKRYRLRGWNRAPYGLFDTLRKEPVFLPRESYGTVMRCDGAHDLNPGDMDEVSAEVFSDLLENRIIRPAVFGEYLLPEQDYMVYPARYKRGVHWSVTGACNLRCRHCFMSAPHAKHGNPRHDQLMDVVKQLAECGVFQVGITGGEPLIREDFLEIVEALIKNEIGIDVIYTNGWLVDEAFLDGLESAEGGRKTPFQISFDGVGCHDFLRGVPGAEERTLKALKLLRDRDHPVSVSFSLHRKNLDSLRETVKLMASLGVRSIKVGSMMSLGEWMNPELRDLELTGGEKLAFFEDYIPLYFEDDAPLSIMLSGSFSFTPGNPSWSSFFINPTEQRYRDQIPACGSLLYNFYIGADGTVAPCMGMADCGIASRFPNLYDTPLRDILGETELMEFCGTTVSDVHNGNPECSVCEYKDQCCGGCRNTALMDGDNYFGADHEACFFFKNNGPERIRKAAEPAFREYLKRHPEESTQDDRYPAAETGQ